MFAMRKPSARFELHSAGKMRIEDLFVDSQAETGVSIPTALGPSILSGCTFCCSVFVL